MKPAPRSEPEPEPVPGDRAVAAIALGANLGEPERTLKRALSMLEKTPGVVLLRRSRWHNTAPVGGPPGQPDYLNGAVLVETTLTPRALLAACQDIEQRLGLVRAEKVHDGPRLIDLDVLFHGDARVDDDELTLPHPRMEDRLFVLEPLAEIAPGHVLQRSGATVGERVRALREDAAACDA